jgi:hypothetical protein
LVENFGLAIDLTLAHSTPKKMMYKLYDLTKIA